MRLLREFPDVRVPQSGRLVEAHAGVEEDPESDRPWSRRGRQEIAHLVGRERLDDRPRDRRDLESRQRIGADVVLRHDPVTEHAERACPGGDGGRLATALDEVGQPGPADVQVDIGQREVAIVGTGEVAIGVQALEVELDRPLRQDSARQAATKAATTASKRWRRGSRLPLRAVR
jgi:hypothetical protein